MLQNFTVIAIIITFAWIGLIGYYIYLSNQQAKLEEELQELQELVARELE